MEETTSEIVPTDSSDLVVIVEHSSPSVKDQIVTASIGLGISLAAGAVLLGVGALVQTVGGKLAKRRAKKEAAAAIFEAESPAEHSHLKED